MVDLFFTGAVAMVRFFIFSAGWNFDWWITSGNFVENLWIYLEPGTWHVGSGS